MWGGSAPAQADRGAAIVFATVRDVHYCDGVAARMQVKLQRGVTARFAALAPALHRGDVLDLEGVVERTARGELTILAAELHVAAACLLPWERHYENVHMRHSQRVRVCARAHAVVRRRG